MLSSAGNAIPDSKAFLFSSNFTFTWQPAAGSTCTKLSMSAHFANHKAQFFRHNSRNECLTRESESDITHKRGKMDSTNPVFAPRRAVFRSNWAIIRNIEQLFGRRKNCDDCVASSHTWWLWWWISMMLIRFHFGYTLNLNPHHLEVDISYIIHIYVYMSCNVQSEMTLLSIPGFIKLRS